MATDKPLKAAMVGLRLSHSGTVGPEQTSFMRTFHHLEGVEVTAFCEWRNTDFLNDAKENFPSAGRYDNLDDLIAKEDFDLACVVLSPSQIPEACRKLAEASKHFFVDKPLASSAHDLVPAVKAVKSNGLTTFLGYPYRFHPPAMDLKRLIDEGVLGRPLNVESRQFSTQVGGELGKEPISVRYTKDGYEVPECSPNGQRGRRNPPLHRLPSPGATALHHGEQRQVRPGDDRPSAGPHGGAARGHRHRGDGV